MSFLLNHWNEFLAVMLTSITGLFNQSVNQSINQFVYYLLGITLHNTVLYVLV